MTTKEKARLRQFVGALFLIVGIAAGFGSMSNDGADDAIERGRALQDAALSLGCIAVGLFLLFWKAKKGNGTDAPAN
jgi:hypothetical protein